MDAKTISQIIARDLAENPDFDNSHDLDLRSCLVPPQEMTFEDSFRPGSRLLLWVVLEERTSSSDGYLVVFDAIKGAFGLATPGKNGPVFIGYYGSFTNTLASM